MRRRREDESSLELLLDTMCNTFGGVMFIAITLAVVIAGRQIAPKHEEKSRIEEVRSLQNEIAVLEKLWQEKLAEEKCLQKERDMLRQDSRMQQLTEIVQLENTLRDLQVQKALETEKRVAAEAEKASLEIELRKLRKKSSFLTSQRNETDRLLAAARTECDALKEKIRRAAPQTLVFHVLEEKPEVPYYIFLRGDRAWCVGPRIDGDQLQPENDVTMTKTATEMEFHILPERGCAVLQGNALNESFNRLLSAVPAGRIAVFVVEPSSAGTFCTLRQLLKKAQIPHGFCMYEKLELFALVFSSNVRYEY